MPYDDDHPEVHYEDLAGHLLEFTHDGIAVHLRDDGPTNAMFCGTWDEMPQALRDAGLVPTRGPMPGEDDDDD